MSAIVLGYAILWLLGSLDVLEIPYSQEKRLLPPEPSEKLLAVAIAAVWPLAAIGGLFALAWDRWQRARRARVASGFDDNPTLQKWTVVGVDLGYPGGEHSVVLTGHHNDAGRLVIDDVFVVNE